MTLIGERGITLSGGQKARVSLARALYSESSIILLDDPLSAVDAKVARDLFDLAIKGELVRGKTVVLVTHHLNFAKDADYIVVMDEGKVEIQGTFVEIQRKAAHVFETYVTEKGKNKEEQKEQPDDVIKKEKQESKANLQEEAEEYEKE